MGIIYVIEGNGLSYYGSSSKSLQERIKHHIACYNYWLKNSSNFYTSFEIIKGEYTFRVVEETDNLKERERWWIENNECINHNIPLRSKTEWSKTDKCKNTLKTYRDIHKEQAKLYRDTHPRPKITIECSCGHNYSKQNESRHLKTVWHNRYFKD